MDINYINSRKKFSYLQILESHSNQMSSSSYILKGFLTTILAYGLIEKGNDIICICLSICFTGIILYIDLYCLKMANFYNNLYNEIKEINDNNSEFESVFINISNNYSINIEDFPKYNVPIYYEWSNKSIEPFYIFIFIFEICLLIYRVVIPSSLLVFFVPLFFLGIIAIWYLFHKDLKKNHFIKKANKKSIFPEDHEDLKIIVDEKSFISVTLNWKEKNTSESIDCDLFALIIDNEAIPNEINSDWLIKHLICFKYKQNENSSIRFYYDQFFGSEDNKEEILVSMIDIDNDKDKNIKQIFFGFYIYDAEANEQNFEQIKEINFSVEDKSKIQPLLSITQMSLDPLKQAYIMTVLEKDNEVWIFDPDYKIKGINEINRLSQVIEKFKNNEYSED